MDGALTAVGTLIGSLSVTQGLSGELSADASLNGTLTTAEQIHIPAYAGDYEITPTSETQTIPINGLLAARDITVNPIPSNYGLITWDGSTLTVS